MLIRNMREVMRTDRLKRSPRDPGDNFVVTTPSQTPNTTFACFVEQWEAEADLTGDGVNTDSTLSGRCRDAAPRGWHLPLLHACALVDQAPGDTMVGPRWSGSRA